MLAGQPRVLAGRDALEDQRHVRVRVLESPDVIPREAGLVVEAGRPGAPRLHESPGQVALAAAVGGGVHGDAEPRVAVGDGAPHVIVHEAVVAADVELEDAEVVGRLGDGLQPGVADGGQHLRHAELRGGLRRGGAAARREALDRADRREHHRDADGLAEERAGRVDLGDVAQHARAEGEGVDRQAVAAQRGLRLGAPDEVVPRSRRQRGARRPHDLVQRLIALFQSRAHGRAG